MCVLCVSRIQTSNSHANCACVCVCVMATAVAAVVLSAVAYFGDGGEACKAMILLVLLLFGGLVWMLSESHRAANL